MEIEAEIKGKQVTAILDTGSDCSSISSTLCISLNLPLQKHEKPLLTKGISGVPEQLTEWVALDLHFTEGLVLRQSFNVLQSPPVPMILGRDFLNKNAAEIMRSERELWVDGQTIAFKPVATTNIAALSFASICLAEEVIDGPQESEIKTVSSYECVTIPPQREQLVLLQSSELPADSILCLEGSKQAIDAGLLIARTLADSSRSHHYARVFNPTSCPITVQAGLSLCAVHEVLDVDDKDWSDWAKVDQRPPAPTADDVLSGDGCHLSSLLSLFNEDEGEVDHDVLDIDPKTVRRRTGEESAATLEERWTKDEILPEPDPPDMTREAFRRLVQEALPEQLPQQQQDQVFELSLRNHAVFSRHKEDLGQTDAMKHSIIVEPGTRPIALPPHRANPVQRQIIRESVEKYLKMGIVRPSSSPWACPVVLVTKKDGTIRFCCDWRRLNEVTKKDRMPLPRVDDTLDRLARCTVFSKVDFTAGYWQMLLDEDAMEKSAFVTPDGHFEWTVMGMGLCNAPASFVRMITKVLGGLLWTNCLAYLDDVIIMSPTFAQHKRDVDQVLKKIAGASLKLKASKCKFFQSRMDFLGFIVTADQT